VFCVRELVIKVQTHQLAILDDSNEACRFDKPFDEELLDKDVADGSG